MNDNPAVVAEQDVDCETHPHGMNLTGPLDDESRPSGQALGAEQTFRSLQWGAGEAQVGGDQTLRRQENERRAHVQ